VQLDALFIEGMVHVTELGADYFQFDEARHELRGERTGIRYQLTDRVTVQVSRVDLDARRIDLRLVTEPGIRTVLKNEARRAESEQQARAGKAKAEPKPKAAAPGKAKTSKSKRVRAASVAPEKARPTRAYSKAGKKKR